MTNQTALIVDDSRTAQIKLQRMLRPYPLEINTVDSAEEALSYLSSERPTVIFMDHSMPGMDGLEALKIIRSNPETAVIPVIMYTAQKGDVYVGRAQAAGANEVLSKDVMDEQSLEKVLRFVRLAPKERPARRPNVTSISARERQQYKQLDESKAIARALSGKASNGEQGEEPLVDQTDQPTSAEVKISEAPWEKALASATRKHQEMLQSAIVEIKEQAHKSEQPKYHMTPPSPPVDDSNKTRPIWPSLAIIGLLIFVAYQLAEIRDDQNELDRAVREIQIRMNVE